MRRLDFYGANAAAYNSREPEILLAGPAGTGKSLALLAKCLTLLDKYPGARVLFLRGTRASLTQSGLVSWEEKVLGGGHPLLTRHPTLRRVRQSYKFPNGSEFVVGGLDDPGKTLSAEYDAVYIQEATEEGVTLGKYETLLRSLRNGKTPFTQLMADCNPTSPAHWLYRRHQAGALRLYPSTHRDNPAYWDRAAQEWTAAGRAYLATLGRYTGARRNRFLKGLWVAAEGLVYDGYDPAVHLLPAGWQPPSHWRRVWSIDWGFRDPLVVLFWAVDPAGRMHLYREFYRSNVRVEAVAKWCKELLASGAEPRPSAVVADHDPECSATFTAHAGVYCEPADKADRDKGLQEAQGRFDVRADGRPTIFFRPDARCHAPDAALEGEGRPTSLLEELVGYVWKPADPERPKDEPVDVNDHACFSADTLVETADGPRPIEAIVAGDRVLTPHGFRPVVAAGMTDPAATVWELALEDGTTLIGTGNHPVFTDELRFVRLDALRYGVCVHSLARCETCASFRCRGPIAWNGCGSRASCTAGIPSPATCRCDGTSGAVRATGSGTAAATFTATCGFGTTGPSPTGTRSTTTTGTRATTTSPTSCRAPSPSTRTSTGRTTAGGPPLESPPTRTPTPRWCGRRPNGTARRPGSSGTASTAAGSPPRCPSCHSSASGAGPGTTPRRIAERLPGSAPTSAAPPRAGSPAWTTSIASALAARPFGPTASAVPRVARVRVLAVRRLDRRQPVFNLTVADVPEFFANGVRVHNCDAMRYAVRACAGGRPTLGTGAGRREALPDHTFT